MIGKRQYNLVLDGIDSIGQVKINNDVTINVDNMFVRYVIPFTPQAVSIPANPYNTGIKNIKTISDQHFDRGIEFGCRICCEQVGQNFCRPRMRRPRVSRRVPRKPSEENAGLIQLGLGSSFSLSWNLVTRLQIIVSPNINCIGLYRKSVYLEAYDTLVIRDTVYDIQYSDASEEWTVINQR